MPRRLHRASLLVTAAAEAVRQLPQHVHPQPQQHPPQQPRQEQPCPQERQQQEQHLVQDDSVLYRSAPNSPAREFGFRRGLEDKYELGQKLGAGASCTVYEAVERHTGERFAVKMMPKQFGPGGFLDSHFLRRVRNEVDISKKIGKSLNVCYLYGAYETEACVYLVMEQCTGGMLIMRGRYSERQAARLVREVLRTVALCHSKHIMMRDIKPQNVSPVQSQDPLEKEFLFASPDDDSRLKATDFGISVFCRPGQFITQRAGTRVCMAPEVVQKRYTLSADLWSTGILAYLLLTGRLPFAKGQRHSSELYATKQVYKSTDVFNDILYALLDFETAPWDTLSGDARDLVQSLLQRDPEKRPSALEALQHRWLQDAQPLAGSDQSCVAKEIPLSDTIVQRLQRFGTYSRLKQVALRTMANVIAPDHMLVSNLKGLFLELDPADTGREGDFTLTAREMQQLLAEMARDPSGEVALNDFIAALMDWSKLQEDTREWGSLVGRAFEALGPDANGRIGVDKLELLLCGEEGCEAPDILGSALREADVNHDGCIDLDEFRQLLSGVGLGDGLELFETRLLERG
ncbi:hypothetical protein N2152v2_004164 [Parachlorella kessleri]